MEVYYAELFQMYCLVMKAFQIDTRSYDQIHENGLAFQRYIPGQEFNIWFQCGHHLSSWSARSCAPIAAMYEKSQGILFRS